MCGISGAIGDNIDITKIKFLGTLNIDRGEKGAGIYINEKILKTTGKYTNLFYELKNKEVEYPFVLNHTRKPSIANTVDLDSTHPFQSKNTVFCHNGTIKNETELIDYYDLKINPMEIDSKILHEAILVSDFEALKYYTGTATIVLKKDDYVYIFVGGSYDSTSKEITADRELHFTYIGNTVYFSSEYKHLTSIAEDEIYEFKVNTLYKFNLEGEIEETTKIHRESLESLKVTKEYQKVLSDIPEEKHTLDTLTSFAVHFINGAYYYKGKLYTGIGYLNNNSVTGRITTAKSNYSGGSTVYYFFRGFMVLDFTSKLTWENNLSFIDPDLIGHSVDEYFMSFIDRLSDEYLYYNSLENKWIYEDEIADGEVQPPGSETKYLFKEGVLIDKYLYTEEDLEEDIISLCADIHFLIAKYEDVKISPEYNKLLKYLKKTHKYVENNYEII